MMSSVLVVDDKEMMRDSVSATLQRASFETAAAADAEGALQRIAERRPDAVVTDLKMSGLDGLGLLERIREFDDELPVIVMTAYGTVETAVKAMKLGAYDYITKPFEGDELIIAVKRAIRHARTLRENAVLRAGGSSETIGAHEPGRGMDRLIGTSPAMRRVREQVQAVAESQGTVLICGESGTGKEVVARAIHELSPRADGPYLAVNCAALSESLLESELFGHERGAFTGADKLRKGRFELCDGGTLLLDEVSEVGSQTQAKLLRVLQERSFERVGASLSIGVDVRILATSNRNLPRAVSSGQFRQDLFFRLNVLPIHLPLLRDRLEDVPALAEHFVTQFCAREGREPLSLTPDALEALTQYHWPGNVRELQNICERAVVLSSGGAGVCGAISRELIEPWLSWGAASAGAEQTLARIGPAEERNGSDLTGVGSMIEAHGFTIPPDRTLADLEREAIVQTLERFNGHRQKTAQALGIGVRTLGLKLKKWKEERLVSSSL